MENNPQTNNSLDQLRTLSTFHYVLGILTCVFSCFPLLHLAFGLLFQFIPLSSISSSEDAILFRGIGMVFILMGAGIFTLGQILGISIVLSGKYLQRQIKYNYSLVVAALECLFFPLGTALGIFTLILLNKFSVKTLYGIKT